jgi:hypothetical protein
MIDFAMAMICYAKSTHKNRIDGFYVRPIALYTQPESTDSHLGDRRYDRYILFVEVYSVMMLTTGITSATGVFTVFAYGKKISKILDHFSQ